MRLKPSDQSFTTISEIQFESPLQLDISAIEEIKDDYQNKEKRQEIDEQLSTGEFPSKKEEKSPTEH